MKTAKMTTEESVRAAHCIQALAPMNVKSPELDECLELISRVLGHDGWQSLQEAINKGQVKLPPLTSIKKILERGELICGLLSSPHDWVDMQVSNAIAVLITHLHVNHADFPKDMWRVKRRDHDRAIVRQYIDSPSCKDFDWKELGDKPKKVDISENPLLMESAIGDAIRNLFFLDHVARLKKLLGKPKRSSKRKDWDGKKHNHYYWEYNYEGNNYIIDAWSRATDLFLLYPYKSAFVRYEETHRGGFEVNRYDVVYSHDSEAAVAASRFRQHLFYILLEDMKRKKATNRTDKEKRFFWTFGEGVDHRTTDETHKRYMCRASMQRTSRILEAVDEKRGKTCKKYDPDEPGRPQVFNEGDKVVVQKKAHVVNRGGLIPPLYHKPFDAIVEHVFWDSSYGWSYTAKPLDEQVVQIARQTVEESGTPSRERSLRYATVDPDQMSYHYSSGGDPIILFHEDDAELLESAS